MDLGEKSLHTAPCSQVRFSSWKLGSVCPVRASARPFLLLLPQTWGGAGVLLMPKALWLQPGFSEDTVSGLWLPWNLVIPFSI